MLILYTINRNCVLVSNVYHCIWDISSTSNRNLLYCSFDPLWNDPMVCKMVYSSQQKWLSVRTCSKNHKQYSGNIEYDNIFVWSEFRLQNLIWCKFLCLGYRKKNSSIFWDTEIYTHLKIWYNSIRVIAINCYQAFQYSSVLFHSPLFE